MAVENIAVDKPETGFEIERRKHFPVQCRRFEIRRVARHRLDDEIGERLFLTGIGPASPIGKMRRHVLNEKARDMLAGWRKRRVERRREHHFDNRLSRPAVGAGIEVGAFEIAHRRTNHDSGTMLRPDLFSGTADEIGKLGESHVHPE